MVVHAWYRLEKIRSPRLFIHTPLHLACAAIRRAARFRRRLTLPPWAGRSARTAALRTATWAALSRQHCRSITCIPTYIYTLHVRARTVYIRTHEALPQAILSSMIYQYMHIRLHSTVSHMYTSRIDTYVSLITVLPSYYTRPLGPLATACLGRSPTAT